MTSKIILSRPRTFTCKHSLPTAELSWLTSKSAPTEVIALENTLYGTIFPQDEIIRISAYAHSLYIKIHLDGARIWHVAVETGRSIEELCEPFDSVSLCFSKGLGKSPSICNV